VAECRFAGVRSSKDGDFAWWAWLGWQEVGPGILQELLHGFGCRHAVHLVQKTVTKTVDNII